MVKRKRNGGVGFFARQPCSLSCGMMGPYPAERLGGSPRLCFAPKVRAPARALVGRLQGRLPAGCRHAAVIAVGREPPAVFRTKGARAGEGVGGSLAGTFARRLPPCGSCSKRLGGSPRLCFAPKVRAPARALVGRLQGRFARRLPPCGSCIKRLGGSPRLCFAPKVRAPARALVGRLQGRFARRLPPCGSCIERLGGSPRLCFAPKVRALARALVRRLQGRLPAGCRHAAHASSGWAEAPGCVPHRRCARWRGRWWVVCRAVCPQAAAMRLMHRAVGRKPPAVFRTEGARAGEGIGAALAGAFCPSPPAPLSGPGRGEPDAVSAGKSTWFGGGPRAV